MTGAHPSMLPRSGQESLSLWSILPLSGSSQVKKCLMRYGPIDLDTIGPVGHSRSGANHWGIQWVTARDIPAQLLLFILSSGVSEK